MPTKNLEPAQYQEFAQFLQQQCGIVLGENKQYLVRSRLSPLMKQHNIESMAELVKQAMQPRNKALRVDVIEAMTTNETFWFRDNYPYELLGSELLPEMAKAGKRVRVWSSACSSGQEPYSMAMIVNETRLKRPGMLMNGVEIVATDLSTQILDQAKAAEYDELALTRGLSPERRKQFFEPSPKGMRVKQDVRNMVSFRQLNLLDSYALLGKFDIIFCRNVLIYFSAADKGKILRQFAAALNPGGYLVLGASESLAGLSDAFEMVRYPSGIVHRKR
ncbi:CheR family methyltransferase [Ferrimonas aestuarii]|uniref:Chemotaxis protein methyltransferase n=1 Tax=Ferrimonas aestuarii TaxID=2569539 RepID=A0A4U1BRI3_9GAMM|nr:protein-glutamate O-methyltransferase CheR [Ferrimonas aestuarii]TKB58213.1 protein-glutamate O-methyltransferase CheR [Ferrimonas aestuarii]